MKLDATFSVPYTHRLRFTDDALSAGNPVLADVIREGDRLPAKAIFFIDQDFADAWPNLPLDIRNYAAAHADAIRLAAPVQYVPGGEKCKNDPADLRRFLGHIDDAGICRQSYVVVIGGGAVLDAVGFAAAVAHRGVRLIRLPTTTLAQADSGVGVKCGINAFNKKNYLGSFTPPWAVVNDRRFLTTLTDRDWRCGFVEAVKVACIKDRAFFDRTVAAVGGINARDMQVAMPIIEQSAVWHIRHITQGASRGPAQGKPDPFEMTTARPLDFGHWAAHKLEQMTNFRLRHGEAVAIGIAIDVVYSRLIGLLDAGDAAAVLDCLARLGFALHDDAMAYTDTLLRGLEEFREHLGGELTITLLKRIGEPVDVHEMDHNAVREAIQQLGSASTAPVAR